MSSQTESLFHDGRYGVNETFEPEFDPCETFNLTTEALSVCKNATNKACMYDYCVTRNDQIAANTLQQDQTFQQDQLIRGNGVEIKGNRFGNKIVLTQIEPKVALRFCFFVKALALGHITLRSRITVSVLRIILAKL